MKKILRILTIFGALCSAHARNHPPVLVPIGNKTVAANQNLSFTISATDPDKDPLTYNATGLPAGATSSTASTIILPGGTVAWQPPGSPSFSWTPASSQVGNHTVTFNVKDSHGKTASETITITVTNPLTSPSPAPTSTSSVPTSPSPVATSTSPVATSPSAAPNNPPVLAPIGNKTVQAGTNLSFSIMAHDPDTDAL